MQNRAPSHYLDDSGQSQRSLDRAREIGAAGEDPAAEELKREVLGRLQETREKGQIWQGRPFAGYWPAT